MNAAAVQDTSLLEEKRILVIEDDPDIAGLIQLHLKDVYETVQLCDNGPGGLQLALNQHWDLILLDIRLPGIDGLEICRQVRAECAYTPILMVTSKSSELDHVLGLEMGADDYVTKPFSVMTLMSRIKAILRRVNALAQHSPEPEQTLISHRDIELDTAGRSATINQTSVDLTAREFDLLTFLLRHPGKVFSRAELLDKVWGYGHEGYEHTVNTHINRLRTKIERDPTNPCYLVTVWGVGYKLGECS